MEAVIEIISNKPGCPVLFVFESTPTRRQNMIQLILEIGDITIFASNNEVKGIAKLEELEKVDLVIIGSNFSLEARNRIKKLVEFNFFNTKIIEPGFTYTYNLDLIKKDILDKLKF